MRNRRGILCSPGRRPQEVGVRGGCVIMSPDTAVTVIKWVTLLKLPARRPCIRSLRSSGTGDCRFTLVGELYFPDQLEDSPAE